MPTRKFGALLASPVNDPAVGPPGAVEENRTPSDDYCDPITVLFGTTPPPGKTSKFTTDPSANEAARDKPAAAANTGASTGARVKR